MELREVKQRFFALRNGLLADMLRKQCMLPHRVIFGLNLPQIKEIATSIGGADASLAAQLWADADCRESRLLAAMVCPPSPEALSWLTEVNSVEEADVICHRLLRRCPGALEAASEAANADEPLTRYAALRLLLNLLPDPPAEKIASHAVETMKFHPLTDAIARQIRSELTTSHAETL